MSQFEKTAVHERKVLQFSNSRIFKLKNKSE